MAGEREELATARKIADACTSGMRSRRDDLRTACVSCIAAALASRPAPEPAGGEVARATRKSCNRHADCAAAEARVIAQGRRPSASFHFHCHDEGCDECFGY